jgi:hypothetical protein
MPGSQFPEINFSLAAGPQLTSINLGFSLAVEDTIHVFAILVESAAYTPH